MSTLCLPWVVTLQGLYQPPLCNKMLLVRIQRVVVPIQLILSFEQNPQSLCG